MSVDVMFDLHYELIAANECSGGPWGRPRALSITSFLPALPHHPHYPFSFYSLPLLYFSLSLLT